MFRRPNGCLGHQLASLERELLGGFASTAPHLASGAVGVCKLDSGDHPVSSENLDSRHGCVAFLRRPLGGVEGTATASTGELFRSEVGPYWPFSPKENQAQAVDVVAAGAANADEDAAADVDILWHRVPPVAVGAIPVPVPISLDIDPIMHISKFTKCSVCPDVLSETYESRHDVSGYVRPRSK